MMLIHCIRDVNMYETNASGERVRNGITAFIAGFNYEVKDYCEESGEACLVNQQGDNHYWNFDHPTFTKHFTL